MEAQQLLRHNMTNMPYPQLLNLGSHCQQLIIFELNLFPVRLYKSVNTSRNGGGGQLFKHWTYSVIAGLAT